MKSYHSVVFLLGLSEIFPAYFSYTQLSFKDVSLASASFLHLSIHLFSPFLYLSPSISFSFSFFLLSHLSLPTRFAIVSVPSIGTIDVSIPVGWCSLAFATVSACSKSAGVVCPAVLRLPRPFPPYSSTSSSLCSDCQLLLVSKSMGRVLSRSSMREYAITKVRARGRSRDCPLVFVSSSHANRSRPFNLSNNVSTAQIRSNLPKARRIVELLSIVIPLIMRRFVLADRHVMNVAELLHRFPIFILYSKISSLVAHEKCKSKICILLSKFVEQI